MKTLINSVPLLLCQIRLYFCLILLAISGTAQYAQAQPMNDSLSQPADTPVYLHPVQVEAYQMNSHLRTVPGSLSLLSSEGLQITDGTNLSDALNTLPGVAMQSGTYTTNRIVIRGMGSRTPYNTNRIRTYLNEIPLTTADGLSTPEEIDMQSIGRIEIIKGPSSALYGSGLGGSINIFTPVPESNGGILNVQYGSFNTLKAGITGQYKSDRSSFQTNISHLQSDGYRENNHYKRTALSSTASTEIGKWRISILLLLTGVNAGIPSSIGKSLFDENPKAAASNWNDIQGYKKYIRGIAGISLSKAITPRLINKFTVFGRGTDSFEKRPFNNLDDRTVSFGVRNKLTLHHDHTDWVFGTEWIMEEYSWQIDTSGVQINSNRENRSQVNLFTLFYYRPSRKFNISFAGALNYIRYRLTDLYPGNGNQEGRQDFPLIFSPRIGINYSPNTRFAIYATAGHGFSLPSPEEALLPQGDINADIKHEQGLQFEIGGRLNLAGNKLGLDAVLYWIELKDLLVTKRFSEDIFSGINAGKTRHQGFEIMLYGSLFDSEIFPGKFKSSLSYTNSLNRFIEFTDDGNTYDGNLLPGIPDQVFYLITEWKPIKILGIMADIRYTGSQYLDDANTLDYRSYVVGNLKLTTWLNFRKAGQITFYGGINNLGNTSYASMLIVNATGFNGSEPRYYYPGLPRHVYFGIRFSF